MTLAQIEPSSKLNLIGLSAPPADDSGTNRLDQSSNLRRPRGEARRLRGGPPHYLVVFRGVLLQSFC